MINVNVSHNALDKGDVVHYQYMVRYWKGLIPTWLAMIIIIIIHVVLLVPYTNIYVTCNMG